MTHPLYQATWDIVVKDIDNDIKEAFEKIDKGNYAAWELVHDPHLTVVTLQLVRELKKKRVLGIAKRSIARDDYIYSEDIKTDNHI